MTGDGYRCARCGEWHDELPFTYHASAPAGWLPEFADDELSALSDEQCVMGGHDFFVRARIVLPVTDAPDDFEWGVWVSLSEANFDRMSELWQVEGRESEPPYFGWLTSDLPLYEPTTLGLKTQVHTQPVGLRPLVELEPSEHPLAIEQRGGITRRRVEEIASALLHG